MPSERRYFDLPGQITSPIDHACMRSAQRDRQFEELYREQRPYIYKAAHRLGVQAEDVEDIVQQVFMIAHTRLHSFEARSTVKTWLVGILRNVVKNARRRRPQRRGTCSVCEDRANDSLWLEYDVEDLTVQRVFLEVLLRLDPKTREAFVAYVLDGRNLREIAEATESSISAVHARIRAARAELFRRFDPA